MSPRSTHALHEVRDLEHLPAIVLVGLERRYLGGNRGLTVQSRGTLEYGPADRLGSGEAGRLKLSQRSQRFRIKTDADG